jgi:hypothetical protein
MKPTQPTQAQADNNFEYVIEAFKANLTNEFSEEQKVKLINLFFDDIDSIEVVYDMNNRSSMANAVRAFGLDDVYSAYHHNNCYNRWLYGNPQNGEIRAIDLQQFLRGYVDDIPTQILRYPQRYGEFMWMVAPALCDLCGVAY